jgi:peptide/nickel transport system permease protein
MLGQDATPEERDSAAAATWVSTSRSMCSSRASSQHAVQGEFGSVLPPGPQGVHADRRAAAGDAGAVDLLAALLALLLGIPMGVYTALRRGWPAVATLFVAVSLVGVSLPTFLIGILLILRVRGGAGLAAVLRTRRRRSRSGWLDHGLA